MSSCFDYALPIVLEHEGGERYTDDPKDPGGATKWGISLRALRGLGPVYGDLDDDGDVDADDVAALSLDDARRIYRERYWADWLDQLHPQVAVRLFDHWVNAGPRSAALIAQRACRAHGQAIAEDGVVGPKTLAALVALGKALVPAIRCERAAFYRAIVAGNEDFERFERGWLRRAYF